MEITDVEAYAVNVPLLRHDEGGIAPYVTNHDEITDMTRVLVKVDTNEGISGWGEMRVFLSPAATISVLEDGVGPVIRGHSPFEVESLRRLVFIEYTNIELFFAAVEMACWDIIGQTLNKPVYELLGGWTAPDTTARRRDSDYDAEHRVEVAYCLGILSPEKSRTHAARALNQGYDVLKTKAGRDWQQDVQRIEAMHDEVDGQLEFRLDPNQGWTFDQAVRVAANLEDAGIYLQYLEQPIRVNAHQSLARLRQRVRQPIAPNEDTYIPQNLPRLIEHGALDVAVVDMTPAGGITGLRQVAAIAEEMAVPMAHHCAFDLGIRTAAILHATYGIPGFSLPADTVYYAWRDDVIEEPLSVENGSMEVPQSPGLGIDVAPEKVAEYQLDH